MEENKNPRPVFPSTHLIEFYARVCTEKEFDCLLTRRRLFEYQRQQAKELYWEALVRISAEANLEEGVLV